MNLIILNDFSRATTNTTRGSLSCPTADETKLTMTEQPKSTKSLIDTAVICHLTPQLCIVTYTASHYSAIS